MATSRLKGGLRGAALLVLGVVSLHELRFLLGYGSTADEALANQGHGYLAQAVPALAGVVALAIVASIVCALAGVSQPRRRAGSVPLWTAAVLFAYATQELVEGAVSTGHPAGLDALTAARGWVALPLAVAVGGLVNVILRLLDRADLALTSTRRKTLRPRPLPVAAHRFASTAHQALATRRLAFGWARRPPPPAL